MSSEKKVKIGKGKLSFFNDKTTTLPTVSILQNEETSDEADLNFKLPPNLPSSDTENVLFVDKDNGKMGYTTASQISGSFESLDEGAIGISDGSSVSNAMEQIDNWVFSNLVDSPPAPTNLRFRGNTTTSMSFTWDNPTVYNMGLFDTTVPFINSLTMNIYKATSTSSSSIGTISTASGSNVVTGTGTSFTSALEGNALTVPGSTWTTGVRLFGNHSEGDSSIITDGWNTDPSSITNEMFVFNGYTDEYKISSVSGTYEDTTSQMTLTLDRDLTSDIIDNTELINQETKVITQVTNSESLEVNSNFINTVSEKTGTVISYPTSYDNTIPITDINNLPRESAGEIVEALQIYIDGSITDGISGTIDSKHKYQFLDNSISNTDYLKIEIFFGNNSTLPKNKIFIANQKFISPGVPSAPVEITPSSNNITNISNSTLRVNYNVPIDNDINTAGNNSEPAISDYKIVYSSDSMVSGFNRYNSSSDSITHTEVSEQTVNNGTSLNRTFTNQLHLGQVYTFVISAKNSINSNYGASLTYTANYNPDLSLISPSALSTFSLINDNLRFTYDGVGRLIESDTTVSHDILDLNDIDDNSNPLSYNLDSVQVNRDQSALMGNTVQFLVNRGTNGSYTDTNDTTFFKPFSDNFTSSGSIFTGASLKLKLSNQEDTYDSDIYKKGYWSQLDILVDINKISLPASTDYYNFQLQHKIKNNESDLDSEADLVSSIEDSFHIDDLANIPVIDSITDISFTDTNKFSVSGLPSRGDGFQMSFNANVQYLGRHFLRNDKLLTSSLRFNSSSISSENNYNPSGVTSFTYSDSSGVTTPIDQSKYISLPHSVTYGTSNIFTRTNNISLRSQAYSIKANSNNYEHSRINGTDLSETLTGKYIYMDTVSHNLLFDTTNKVFGKASSSSGVITNYPEKITIENNDEEYPDVFTGSGTGTPNYSTYDHSEKIVGNSDTKYNYELQFINGAHRTSASDDAFLDYSSSYLDRDSDVMLDYSAATANEFRYSTFRFNLSGNSQKNINYFDILFHNVELDTSTTISTSGVINTNHFQLYIQLIDGTNYPPTGDETSYTSVWLDGNAIANAAVTASKTNWSSGEPRAVLENASSGNTKKVSSSNYNRRIILVPGTDTDNLVVFVRVGLLNNVDNYFSHVTLEY